MELEFISSTEDALFPTETQEFVMMKSHNCVAFMLIIFIRDQIKFNEWYTML